MESMELKVGWKIVDQDPRMGGARILTITAVLPNGVEAQDRMGRKRIYMRRSIHTDGKPRRSGFALMYPTPTDARG